MNGKGPSTDAAFEALRRAHRSEQAPDALRRRGLARARGAGLKTKRREPRRWLTRGSWLALAAGLAGASWFGFSRHAVDPSGGSSLVAQHGVVLTAEPGAAASTPVNAAPNAAPNAPSSSCPKPLPHSLWNPAELAGEARFNELQVRVFETETAGCGPLTRRYLERVPPEAADSGAALIVLHDAGQSAEAALLQTRWWFGELARRTSTLLVYANGGPIDASAHGAPQVLPGAGAVALQINAGVWQGDRGAHPAVDDVAYLRGIVDDLNAQRALGKDPEVFLAGYGSGAVMALVAALQHPERYAGVAAFLPSLAPGSAELRKALASAIAPRLLSGGVDGRAPVWRLRSIFIVLPSSAGKDPSALAEQWAGAFGAEPGAIHVTLQKPGLQRIDTTLRGDLVGLRILLLSKQVDPFPLPGGGDETARAASMARPFFFDGPGAAWDFFQRETPGPP